MKHFTKANLITMLFMQHKLNSRIDNEWYKKDQDFPLAIMVEAGEFADHATWKWWAKQEPNTQQAQTELIDIWHFGLAMCVRLMLRQLPELVEATEGEWQEHRLVNNQCDQILAISFERPTYSMEMREGSATVRAIANVKKVVTYAIEDELFAIGHAVEAMRQMGIEDLFKMFVSKNVLNIFRQLNGYKSGSYIKEWHGVEDNVHLSHLMEGWNPDEGVSWLMEQLADKYVTVLEQNGREGEAKFV